MKLWGVAMVRNEADIIETFVRHNLSILDGLTVIDHGSADATLDILKALTAERLPLEVLRVEEVKFVQAEVVTEVVRRVFAARGADFAFPLDADEFVKTPSRGELERALASVPMGVHAQLYWLNYVPDFADTSGDMRAAIARARRARTDEHGLHKVAVGNHFMSTPEAIIVQGLHFVAPRANAPAGTRGPHARLRASAVAIAHLPLRSAEQYVVKVAVKKLGRLAVGNDWTPDSAMQAAYAALRGGGTVDANLLRLAASNWSVPVERWTDPEAREWLDDPFLATFPLRYTPPAAAAATRIVLDAVARLVQRLRDERSRQA